MVVSREIRVVFQTLAACWIASVVVRAEQIKYDAALATAVIKGVVVLDGAAPEMPEIKIESDPKCVSCRKGLSALKKEYLIVSAEKKVANTVVYVSKGAEKYDFKGMKWPNATINIAGCQYVPHVLNMVVGQKVEVVSEACSEHNPHFVPKESFEGGVSQQFGKVMPRAFDTVEMGIEVRCDVHSWMKAFICVFDHPFLAVTNENGLFEIKVPPGEYVISTWQEMKNSKKLVMPEPQTVTATSEKPVAMTLTLKMQAK